MARTFGGMSSLFFIALTTPMIEIFAMLKSLRIPDFLLELSMMIYRYIFVFLDQAAMIHNAQVMRLGDAGTRNSLNSFAMLSSVLFLRSWEQGERLIVAMDARCYNGMLDLMDQCPLQSQWRSLPWRPICSWLCIRRVNPGYPPSMRQQ